MQDASANGEQAGAAAQRVRPQALRRLRLTVILGVLALNALAAATIGLFLADSWRHARDHALHDVENLNVVISGDLEAQFGRADLCLQRIVDAYAHPAPGEPEAMQAELDRAAKLLPGIEGLRIVGPQGDLMLKSGGPLSAAINIADKERFQILRDQADIGLYVSRPEMGRLTPEWLFTLGRRLVRADGGFAGEVHASVSLAHLERLFAELKLPKHAVVGLWTEEPRMIARFPALPHRDDIAKAQPSPELRLLLAGRVAAARFETSRGVDGERRLLYLRKLSGLPLYLTIGAATRDLVADWLHEASQFGVVFALIVIASVAGGRVFYTRAVSRLAAEAQLKIAALVFDNSVEAMVVLDSKGLIISVNNAYVELTGMAAERVIGRNAMDLPRPANQEEQIEAIGRQMAETGYWVGDIWSLKQSGESFLAHASLRAIRDEPLGLTGSVMLFSDITEQKRAEEAAWTHANLDPVTALPNRRRFRERLGEEIARAQENGDTLGLIFIDLDRFKDINDSLGHHSGDLLLKEAAERVRGCVRAQDFVARLGGDEFTVVLAGLVDIGLLEQAAQRIVTAFSTPFRLAEETCFVSASLGLAVYPSDARDADDLLRGADMAMYAAKRSGRNRYVFFEAGMQTAQSERAELTRDLRQAIARGQFELHYQPIVTLASGSVDKAEALIRWRHPTRGLVSPDDFIPLAEETGLIVEVGDWVFEAATRQLAAWRREYDTALSVSVNVSPVQFAAGLRQLQALPERLAALGLAGRDLILEITEGVLLGASAETQALITDLTARGLEFALDDFGTGYSSLAYLRQHEIGFLKIDRMFVDGLADGGSDLAICEAVIAMARRLGIAVIAEGVETEQQRERLAAAQCDYGQGYGFARPMPAEAFAAAYLRRPAGEVAAA